MEREKHLNVNTVRDSEQEPSGVSETEISADVAQSTKNGKSISTPLSDILMDVSSDMCKIDHVGIHLPDKPPHVLTSQKMLGNIEYNEIASPYAQTSSAAGTSSVRTDNPTLLLNPAMMIKHERKFSFDSLYDHGSIKLPNSMSLDSLIDSTVIDSVGSISKDSLEERHPHTFVKAISLDSLRDTLSTELPNALLQSDEVELTTEDLGKRTKENADEDSDQLSPDALEEQHEISVPVHNAVSDDASTSQVSVSCSVTESCINVLCDAGLNKPSHTLSPGTVGDVVSVQSLCSVPCSNVTKASGIKYSKQSSHISLQDISTICSPEGTTSESIHGADLDSGDDFDDAKNLMQAYLQVLSHKSSDSFVQKTSRSLKPSEIMVDPARRMLEDCIAYGPNAEYFLESSRIWEDNASASTPLFPSATGDSSLRASMPLAISLAQAVLQGWLHFQTRQMAAAAAQNSSGPKTPTGISRHKSERERKIGHRRVGVGGEITYKKIQTSQIMGSIQLGIQHAVGGLASKPERDLLMQDFMTVETTNFPSEGSNHTPAHHYLEFRFRTYAPIAFRYFRDLFGIQPDDFLISMCSAPLRELSNPGASGSIFYLTEDDEFIIKTVQHKEGEFLQKLLPGYYMNLNQNPRTLLPKFFGLYCYQCNSKNVRLVAMNNLLPSSVKLHQKYDLKGSTYKRKASKSERQKNSPTYKDLDFMEHHPEGIGLEADTYSALVKTIQRDCRVLESFKIMDYSLLVGIHNLDQATREKVEKRSVMGSMRRLDTADSTEDEGSGPAPADGDRERGATALNRSRSINRQRLVAHSTAMESIQAESEPIDEEEDVPPGGIPARNSRGERLLLFVGIIDILQSYRLKKKLEHTWKAMIHDGDTVSVHRPGFYAQRFQEFMAKKVFKKIPSPLKHSPSKRKSISRPLRSLDIEASDSGGGFVSSHSPLPCSSTPPPAFEDALRGDLVVETAPLRHRLGPVHATSHHVRNYRETSETVSVSDVRLESRTDNKSSLSVESSSSTSGFGSGPTGRNLTWTPPASVEGSTPTWTEGTPSFTESSSSGDIGPSTPMRSLNLRCSSEGPKSASNEGSLDCLDSEMTHL